MYYSLDHDSGSMSTVFFFFSYLDLSSIAVISLQNTQFDDIRRELHDLD